MRYSPSLPLLLFGFFFCYDLGELPAQDDSGFKYLQVKVVDAAGKPMSEVPVDIRVDGSEFPMPTDDKGVLAFNVPTDSSTRMRLKVKQPGYVELAVSWDAGESLPDSFTFQMQKGTTIGGLIHDEEGQPIEGVEIEAHIDSLLGTNGDGKVRPVIGGLIATTDSKGYWQYDSAPSKRIDILTDFKHPDYAYENVFGYRAGNWEQLHSLKHIVVLQKGIVLRGQVLDPDGLPAEGAKVTLSKGRYYSDEKATQTDGDGRYVLRNVMPGRVNATVLSDDWAPESKPVVIKPGLQPLDFKLQPGRTVKVRIVDQKGEPLEGVAVTPDDWRTLEVLPRSATKTDAQGVWEWDLAPADAIDYRFWLNGYMSTSGLKISPREEPYEVVMPPELVFTGNVTDAKTGLPIEEFRVVEGIFWRETDDKVAWQTHRKELGKKGRYRVAYNSGHAGFRIKIEAQGYRPQISRLVAIDEGKVPMDFALEPGAGPAGIVLQPDGKPSAGAQVIVAAGRSYVRIENGTFSRNERLKLTETDEAGRFQLPNLAEDFFLVCLHEQGWVASKRFMSTASNLELKLQEWAKVEGDFLQDGKGVADAEISLWYPGLERQMRDDRIQWNFRALTDEAGRFVFPRVRPGKATVQRNKQFGLNQERSLGGVTTHAETFLLTGGESIRVHLGSEGRKVVGQFVPPKGYDQPVPWRSGRVTLSTWDGNQRTAKPTDVKTDMAVQPPRQLSFAAQIEEDGSFAIADVPAGSYRLLGTVYQRAEDQNNRWSVFGRYTQTVVIPDGDAEGDSEDDTENSTEDFDLGTYTLTIEASSTANE